MNCRTFSQNPRTRGKSHHHHSIIEEYVRINIPSPDRRARTTFMGCKLSFYLFTVLIVIVPQLFVYVETKV